MVTCNNPGFLRGIDPTPSLPPLHVKALFRSFTLQPPLKMLFSSSKLASMHNSVFIKELSRLTKFFKCGFGAPMRYQSVHPQGALQSAQQSVGERQKTHPIQTHTGPSLESPVSLAPPPI